MNVSLNLSPGQLSRGKAHYPLTIIINPISPSNSQNYIIVILAAAPPCSKNTFILARDAPFEMEATSSVTQSQVSSYKLYGGYIIPSRLAIY